MSNASAAATETAVAEQQDTGGGAPVEVREEKTFTLPAVAANATVEAPKERPPLVAGNSVAAIIPKSIEEIFRLAQVIAAARWAPKSYLVDPKVPSSGFDTSKIVVGIMHGLEVGMTPLAALQSIAVINGTPAIFGDAVVALVRAKNLLQDLREEPIYRKGANGEPEHCGWKCTVWRRGIASPVIEQFTLADAIKAKLIGKPGPWQDYPLRMCQWRARAWAFRLAFADALRGLAIAEEAQDLQIMVPSEAPQKGKPERPRAVAALDVFAGNTVANGENSGRPNNKEVSDDERDGGSASIDQ